jgi:Transposase DDE domain
LGWKVFKRQGQFKRRHIESLLRRVARALPANADPRQIWVVGDKEFQSVALQAFVEHQLGWNYVQRIKRNVWLYPPDGQGFQPQQLDLRPGQTLVRANVTVTRQAAGPAHLIAHWAPGYQEQWFLISNRPIGRQMLPIYERRFWTEPMYRDFKSYGWNLEASRITDPKRFERLLLGITLAYVWLIQLGSWVVKSGQRYLVDRTARRTLSLFRIGWRWLRRRLDRGNPLRLPDLLYT